MTDIIPSPTEQPVSTEDLRAIEASPVSVPAHDDPVVAPITEPFLRRVAIQATLGGPVPEATTPEEARIRAELLSEIHAMKGRVELPFDLSDITDDVGKFAADQPRAPAGSPDGGQWVPLKAGQLMHQKLSGPAGSNPGGIYKGSDGVKRYIKQYSDPTQAHGERLANQIYRDLGFTAPRSEVAVGDGWTLHAAELVEGYSTLQKAGLTPARAEEILQGFPVDVLTANWDAVGTGHDNILVKPGSLLLRVDQGGSFLMRAQAGRKPEALLNKVTEWDGLAPGGVNPWYAKVFQAANTKPAQLDIKPVVQKIVTLRGEGWHSYVVKHAKGLNPADQQKIISMLEARTQFLVEKAGLVQKYDTGQARAPAGTPDGGQWTKNGFSEGFTSGKDASDWYTSHGYVYINDYLRHGKNPSERVRSAIEHLDTFAQSHTLTKEHLLYRGVSDEAANLFANAETYSVIEDDGFVSLSSDITTANGFAKLNQPSMRHQRAVLEIEVPEGTAYGPGVNNEGEFILPRGARFQKIYSTERSIPRLNLRDPSGPPMQVPYTRVGLRYLGSEAKLPGAELAKANEQPDRYTWKPGDVRILPPRPRREEVEKDQPRAPKGTPTGGQWISTGMGQTTPAGADLTDHEVSVRWKLSAEDPPELNGVPFAPYLPPKDWTKAAGQLAISEPELVIPEGYTRRAHIPMGEMLAYGDQYSMAVTPKPGKGGYRVTFFDAEGTPRGHQEFNKISQIQDEYPDVFPDTEVTKRVSAGAVIQEPDGRVWLLEPMNHFGGYQHTFPKGGQEEGLSLQQTAIKEVWEELGLKVEITGHAFDQERDTSMTRYYWAQRTGGTPTDFGEETYAVHLVPVAHLHRYLNRENDRALAATLLKAPMPPRPAPRSPWKGPGSPAGAKSTEEGRPTSPWLPKGVQDPSSTHWWEKPKNLFGRFRKSIFTAVLKYNANQPRNPAGMPTGGQWASVGIAPPANVMGEGFPGKPTGLNPDKHKAQINKLNKMEKLAQAGKLEELKSTYVAMSAEKKYKEALVNHLETEHTQHYLEQAGLPKMPLDNSPHWAMKQMKTLAAHALSDLDPATAFDHLTGMLQTGGYLYNSAKAYGDVLGAALTQKMANAAHAQHLASLPPAPPTVMTNGKPLTPGIQLKLAQLHGALAGNSPAEAIAALNKITVGMPTTQAYKNQLLMHLTGATGVKVQGQTVPGDSAMTSVLYPKPIPEVGQAMHNAILAALPDPTKESPAGLPSIVSEGSALHELWQKATAPALTLAEKIAAVQAMGLGSAKGVQYTQEVLSTLTGLIGQTPNASPQLATILKPFPQPGHYIETPADVGGQFNLDQMHKMLKIADAAHVKGMADDYTAAMNHIAAIDASSNATMKQYKDALMKGLQEKENAAMGKSLSSSYTGGAFATKGIVFPPKPINGIEWIDKEIATIHAQVSNADNVQQAIDNLKENVFASSVAGNAYKQKLLTVLENHKLATEVGAPQGMSPAQLQNIKNTIASSGQGVTQEQWADAQGLPKPPKAPVQTGTSAGSLWVQNKIQQLTLASNSSDPVNAIAAVSMTKTAPKFLKNYKDKLLQYHQTVGTKAGFAQPAPSSGLAQKVAAVKPKLPPLPEPPAANPEKYTPEQVTLYNQKVAALKSAALGPNPLAVIDTIQGASGAIQTYKSALINHILAHAPVPDAVVGQTVSSYKIVGEHALPMPTKYKPATASELGHLEYYRQNLPKGQKDAVGFYKGSGYQALNAHRFNPGATLPSNHKFLDAALYNSPGLPRDVLLTRRISSKSLAAIAKSLDGKIFTDPAYGSTAYTEGSWHGNVVLKINAPKGTKGIFFSSENEWLLPRNTRYRVYKVESLAGGETRIHAELLPAHEQIEWPNGH